MVRTTLLPGLLKTIRENRSHPLPISIFEIGDIVVKDKSQERQTRNIRHAGAVWCNKTAGFEVVHGLLDRAMKMLEVPRIQSSDTAATHGYYLKESDGETFVLQSVTTHPFQTQLICLVEERQSIIDHCPKPNQKYLR